LHEYLPVYNKKFMVSPISKEDLHRPVPKGIDLDKILCIRTERTVRNDHTIVHDRKLYQIDETVLSKKVTLEQRTNGKMLIVSKGKSLRYHQITNRPEAIKQPVTGTKRKRYIPPRDHPWRGKFLLTDNELKTPQTAVV
jgi:hypothetical protein